MSEKRIYFSPPLIEEEDIQSIADTLRGGWVATVGPQLDEFERMLQDKFHLANVLALNSGTSSLHLAVKLAGVRSGDRVLIGSFTFVAVANAVLYEGGIPVFMDSDPISWNLDPELLEDFLTEEQQKRTLPKAVVVTHIFGFPAYVEQIRAICRRFEICLIEDAAEALGAQVNGRSCGGFGDYGVLSFNGNKLITAGGGGALICVERSDHELAKKWAAQSKERATYYLHEEMGYNYRLTNVLAGLGMSQLRRFDQLLNGRRDLYFRYQEALKHTEWIEFKTDIHDQQPNHWVSPILIRKECLSDSLNPDVLLQYFEKKNIEARRFWRPLHMQPLFKDAHYKGSKIAEHLFDRGLCLPSGNGLTPADFERILSVLNQI